MKIQDTYQSPTEAKKQYLSPELVEIGHVAQLTLTGSVAGAVDGGASP